MKRDESVYLRHILDAIIKADEYLQGLDENSFNGNSLVQDGVIRQIEIKCQRSKHLPRSGVHFSGDTMQPERIDNKLVASRCIDFFCEPDIST